MRRPLQVRNDWPKMDLHFNLHVRSSTILARSVERPLSADELRDTMDAYKGEFVEYGWQTAACKGVLERVPHKASTLAPGKKLLP